MEIFYVNAFTTRPFQGNPASVCIPSPEFAGTLTDTQLQSLAAELCMVEVVYIFPKENSQDGADYHLRFFSQKQEMTFCGHATLAAAFVLFQTRRATSKIVSFSTQKNNAVVCTKCSEDTTDLEMELTPIPPRVNNTLLDSVAPLLVEGLGLRKENVADVILHSETMNLIFVLRTRADVEAAVLQSSKLMHLAPKDVHKVTITAPGADASHNFVTRLFAPWIGIPEDAVSAATNAILALYWAEEQRTRSLVVLQLSQRPGRIVLNVSADRKKVGVIGDAVIVTKGMLSCSIQRL